MLTMIPRVIHPKEIALKKGALIRLKFLESKKVFIICGNQSFESNGNLLKLKNYLLSSNIKVALFKCQTGDPSIQSVNEITANLRKSNSDCVIGVGGGGVMDSAKLACALYENENSSLGDFLNAHSLSEKRKSKLCLIPTTAGSGSEVSNSAVVTIEGKKTPIISNFFIPDIAILDPNLTISLPNNITAYSAIDAFTHGIESYCSTMNNILTDSYSLAGSKLIFENLEKVLSAPDDLKARESLLYGSMITGLAQSLTSVGGVHALSHTVASKIDLPHGNLNAIFLIPMLKYNMEESSRIEKFLIQLGLNGLSELEDWISKISASSNMVNRWGSYSKKININETSEQVLEDVCARTNPRKLSFSAIKSILENTK